MLDQFLKNSETSWEKSRHYIFEKFLENLTTRDFINYKIVDSPIENCYFKVKCDAELNTPEVVDRNELRAQITEEFGYKTKINDKEIRLDIVPLNSQLYFQMIDASPYKCYDSYSILLAETLARETDYYLINRLAKDCKIYYRHNFLAALGDTVIEKLESIYLAIFDNLRTLKKGNVTYREISETEKFIVLSESIAQWFRCSFGLGIKENKSLNLTKIKDQGFYEAKLLEKNIILFGFPKLATCYLYGLFTETKENKQQFYLICGFDHSKADCGVIEVDFER